ncbi:MAG TPA: MerR family transcriptional regulator [Jatrophihabitantaceae bacterium]
MRASRSTRSGWYERIGLLRAIERGPDGRRRFTDADLDWLVVISKLRATGMSVADMRRYAELVRSGAGEQDRLKLLRRHRAVVVQAIADSQECLQLLDDKIGCYIRVVGEEQGCRRLDSAS